MTWKAQVSCKVIETTLSIEFLSAIGFWPKMGQNPYRSIVSAKIWWRHCGVVFNCIFMNVVLGTDLGTILRHAKIC